MGLEELQERCRQLERQIDKLGDTYDKLDQRMRSFETAVKALGLVAAFFGISGLYLWQHAVRPLRSDTDRIEKLSADVNQLEANLSQIPSGFPLFVTQISEFASQSALQRYGWGDYERDVQKLSSFAVDYLHYGPGWQ